MRRFLNMCIVISIIWLLMLIFPDHGFSNETQEITVMRNLTSMPLAFTENQGPRDEQILFRANAGGDMMWFTKDGATYQFSRSIPGDKGMGTPQLAVGSERFSHEPESIESIAIKASFIGANPNPQMVGVEMMEYKCNYFIGNDPNEWHTDVPNYNAIVYEEIYSGIDLKYYGNGKQMEYDFIVSPGADPSQILVQYDGAKSLYVNTVGELVVETEWGEVIEQRPVVYQLQDGVRNSIEGKYLLAGDNSFGFSLGSDYNPTLPLVIDPVLSYGTYLGGSGKDWSYGIAVDGSGNAYITGYTKSSDFPTENPYDSTYNSGFDVFVTKLCEVCDDCEPGNVNGDGTINIFDITYIISYLYMSGPAPIPYEICDGDPNCDCVCNIFDITYLITFLYMTGPPPCTCEEWLTACGPPLRK